ncbi:MAG: restriction endonuclease subunit S, partial [Verrucomicrobia bacterium]|nr:restriction endonuclease subunit S [Verrucomicrobiota bacterium]
GKLVPQDPNDEPAEECLSRLGLKSTIVSLGDDSEKDSLPPAWTRVRFEDVALVAGGVTLGRKLGDRKTVTLPYLRVANVKRGEIDLSVIKEVSIAEDEIERYALRENDLLMTEGGDWDKVGRAAIWRAEIPACLHQNHVFRARMRSAELAPFWFERYFNSPVGRGYFESASKQTTNLASINMRQVRSSPIPLPPLAEQRRIVAKVEQLMALVDALETQLAASRATAANLLSALVAELTAQE